MSGRKIQLPDFFVGISPAKHIAALPLRSKKHDRITARKQDV